MKYYKSYKAYIQNEINLEEFNKRLTDIQSAVESSMYYYRREVDDEKHFEDCLTPMGTYEYIVNCCSKIQGLIDFINLE